MKYIDFYAETAGEEYALLAGRVEALCVYLAHSDEVKKALILEMLGVEKEEINIKVQK